MKPGDKVFKTVLEALSVSFQKWLIYVFVCVFAEILDFGYPQNSETGALKTFITQQGIRGQVRIYIYIYIYFFFFFFS